MISFPGWMRAALASTALLAMQGCDAADTGGEADSVARVESAPTTTANPVGTLLVPPPGFMAAVTQSDKDGRDCPADATPFTAPLDFPSRYEGSDKARDDVNDQAEREYKRQSAPISAMERGLSQQVDDYMRSGREESLACALTLLRNWSSSNALMGQAITHTGKSVRKWAMGSVASAYLRLKFSVSRPLDRDPELQQAVETWLGNLGSRVMLEWQDAPLEKMNNHEYWAAWAAMATGVALNRRDLFDWSLKQFGTAMTQIDAKGFLPNELKRDTRALSYHNYALTPLTMIAAFAKANGVPPDAQAQAALDRLSGRVLDGIENPEAFLEKTGKKQVPIDVSERSKLAWLEPYCWTLTCTAPMQQRLNAMRPLKSYRLGGNLSDIFHPAPGAKRSSSRAAADPALSSESGRFPARPASRPMT